MKPVLAYDMTLDELNRVLKDIQGSISKAGTTTSTSTITANSGTESGGTTGSGSSTTTLTGDATGSGTGTIPVTVVALQGIDVPTPLAGDDGKFLQYDYAGNEYVLADETYTNASATPSSLGGIAAGSTFSAQTMKQMWDALLYPYQYPAFSAFSITGQATTLEVGDTSNVNPSFTWTDTNASNINANSIGIVDTTASETLVTGHSVTPPAAVTHAGVTKTTATTEVYTITGTNSKSQTFTGTFTIAWEWRKYWGETATTPLAQTNIKGLRASALGTSYTGTWSFVAAASEYKYICYPSAWGTASTFKDASTGFNVPMEAVYTVSVTNTFGSTTTYNVHRTTNMIGGALDIVVS